jgi:hypothetical protein
MITDNLKKGNQITNFFLKQYNHLIVISSYIFVTINTWFQIVCLSILCIIGCLCLGASWCHGRHGGVSQKYCLAIPCVWTCWCEQMDCTAWSGIAEGLPVDPYIQHSLQWLSHKTTIIVILSCGLIKAKYLVRGKCMHCP